MKLKTRGIPYNIYFQTIGIITRNLDIVDDNLIYVIDSPFLPVEFDQSKMVIATLDRKPIDHSITGVFNVESTDHLNEGDIVVINTDGIINTLYRIDSTHNFLLFTERCNSNCLMCSQPPKNRNDISYFIGIYQKLIPLIPKNCPEICITGGEPTLLGESFFDLLYLLKTELPDTELHCLTNGRSFAWKKMSSRLASLDIQRLMLGIPLYSDFYQTHDYIVQAKHAFNQTMLGLYHLAEFGQRIEIRIVLHQQSVPRLLNLAKYIYKNLPFVEQVVFMGLEHQGYTPFNIDKLWIDPYYYAQELSNAVFFLADKGMNVSIYNLQLCLLPKDLWQFSKKSISDWKNINLAECNECSQKVNCGGLFASSFTKHSDFIKSIK